MQQREIVLVCLVGLSTHHTAGHFWVAKTALQRLKLDQIWWLVTPGNPLKSTEELADLQQRIEAVKALAQHPRMKVTALEKQLGTAYTACTLASLRHIRPQLKFVWIMGADNLMTFHHWQNWRNIIEEVPVAVVDRPKTTLILPLSQSVSKLCLCQIK